MDVYGVVSLLQMRMMNKSNESMGYWICNHIYITRCVHVSNDVQINVRVWEEKNACICCRCQWLMSPTNCCVQTRAWFTQKWCIINAIAVVWCAYIGVFFIHLFDSVVLYIDWSIERSILTLIFHYTFLLSHSYHRQLILEFQKSLLR